MKLKEYTSYFHDGNLLDIKHTENKVEISLLSAEIIPENMMKNMPPLNQNRISAKLYLEETKNIKVNDIFFNGIIKKTYDCGCILDFEILKDKVILGIEWTNYLPKPRNSYFTKIEIEAKKIWWENVPNLYDPFW